MYILLNKRAILIINNNNFDVYISLFTSISFLYFIYKIKIEIFSLKFYFIIDSTNLKANIYNCNKYEFIGKEVNKNIYKESMFLK
jgi:hypothetical protein